MPHVPSKPRLRARHLAAGALVLLAAGVTAIVTQAAAHGLTVPKIQQIFLVNSAGGDPRQLTSGNVAHSNATWLPGGRRVAELAGRGSLSWIESQTTRGTDPQMLSGSISTPQTAPAMTYSPASHTTAGATFNENQLSDTLELLGPPRTRPTVIDSFPDTGNGPSTPVWSPDGKTLAYTRPKGPLHRPTVGAVTAGPDQIALFNVQTHTRRILPAGSRGASEPLFSPDGKRILFTEATGNYFALEIAPVAGGPARRLASNIGTDNLAWSPDGRNIAFTGYTKGDPQPYLFVLNVRTKRLRKLAGSVQLITPAWSPNGHEIAFATWFTALAPTPPQGYGAVELISANGTHTTVLAQAPGSQTDDLTWDPNGSTIAFTLEPAPKGD
jgi:Tol biopolymer transport system component